MSGGSTPRADERRCWWADSDPLLAAYHDDEWGNPVHDDVRLFQMLSLEAFQAGLSWLTILRKREAFKLAFRGFDPSLVAAFDDHDRQRLMADAGIVRNRAKIEATIANAGALLELATAEGSFDAYLARRFPGQPRRLPRDVKFEELAATTPDSDSLSRDLKRRGFRFVGSTIVYSFMEAVGLVDDHMPYCYRYSG
jgi:DNA-3-methyladenine glycosylase I